MSFNLLDTVKGFFNNEMVSKAAGYLGESEGTIKKGLDAVIPVSLAGIIQKAEDGNIESLINMGKEALGSGILSKLGDTFSSAGGGVPAIGPSLITSLFGDKFGSIANMISSFTGSKGTTASSLFGSVVPLALAALGKHATDTNSTPGAIGSLLSGMKNSVLSAIPAGLNLSNMLGGSAVRTAAVPNRSTAEPVKSGNKWLVPLLLALAAILLLWWLMKTCNAPKETAAVVEDSQVVQPATEPAMTTARESVKVVLPNGKEIDAYKGGIEDQLVTFLKDPAAVPGKDIWFDFSDLNFTFGTAEIVPESRGEIVNIVEILKAFPKAKIKIGGYTDKVGDENSNLKLSGDRAKAVENELKTAGVGGQVEGSEGYGSQFAKAAADAPDEVRAKDRRVSVSVRAK
ncbi:OmpA family protein [Pollutibacter soli]|uniref:OmpA family protein n=1 Tax=Pollutibacter soli TaxID=3034157 RepID=UPI003013320C